MEEAGDLVSGRTRIRDLEVEDGVDLDDQVVLGDDRLGLERDDLLAQIDHRVHPVDVRDDDIESGLQGSVVPAESLDITGTGLRNDAHGPDHGEDREGRDQQAGDEKRRNLHVHSRG